MGLRGKRRSGRKSHGKADNQAEGIHDPETEAKMPNKPRKSAHRMANRPRKGNTKANDSGESCDAQNDREDPQRSNRNVDEPTAMHRETEHGIALVYVASDALLVGWLARHGKCRVHCEERQGQKDGQLHTLNPLHEERHPPMLGHIVRQASHSPAGRPLARLIEGAENLPPPYR